MKIKQPDTNNRLRELGLILLGSFLYAFSLNVFLVPRGIVVGGASGLATALGIVFSLPVGLLIMLINIPLVIANAVVYGLRFTYRTLIGVLLTSVMTDVLTFLPVSGSESLICALLGGACMGAGVGILFHSGITTGGTDLCAFLLKKKFPHISVSRLILTVDSLIILLCALLLSNWEGIFYSYIASIATAFSLDAAQGGLGGAKAMVVVTKKAPDVIAELSDRVRRGTTVYDCKGGYTGEGKQTVVCVVKRPELYYAREAVLRRDPDAFVIITDAQAYGRGFERKM